MAITLDLTGQRYGMLTVIKRGTDCFTPKGRRIIKWICKCECGNVKEISTSHLRSGDCISCGCFHKKRLVEAGKINSTKHDMSKTRIYHLYENMKYRCDNKNSPNYKNYGGRGIKVCEEWSGSDGFERFCEWAYKNGYRDDLTIDRVNVDGDYEPNNCRWADSETQYNNTTKTVRITYHGKTMSAAQWAREIGLDRHTIYERIKKGLPVEQVLAPRQRAKCSWMK